MKHIGETYGSYTIIEETNDKTPHGGRIYVAQCTCGICKRDILSNIKYSMKTNKCPHYSYFGDVKYCHGLIKNVNISSIFRGMLSRCYNEEDKTYRFYGAKGVTICDEWVNAPNKFEDWALSNGYSAGLTIDRIDESLGYFPDNCRWIDGETNTRFKSTTNYITATVTLSGKQWASLIPDVGINYINKLMRNKGEEETVRFIEEKLRDKRK
jgi:hypothetical protein